MTLKQPLVETLPTPDLVRHRLGDALREVELLRKLLRLAECAEEYRRIDQETEGTTRAPPTK
jgi:hypothetical protein